MIRSQRGSITLIDSVIAITITLGFFLAFFEFYHTAGSSIKSESQQMKCSPESLAEGTCN